MSLVEVRGPGPANLSSHLGLSTKVRSATVLVVALLGLHSVTVSEMAVDTAMSEIRSVTMSVAELSVIRTATVSVTSLSEVRSATASVAALSVGKIRIW